MAETNPGTDRQARHHKPPNPAGAQPVSTEASSSLESDSASSKSTSTTVQVETYKQSVKKPHARQTIPKKNSLPFTVCHWNCAKGITNKICDIKLAIGELKPTVMFVSEADRATTHDDKLININGYQLHNSKSRDTYGKSRIVAYIREGSNLIRRHDLESPEAELIIFDKTYQNNPMVDRIIGLYRPFTGPNGDSSSGGAWTRYTILINIINKAINGCNRVTIIGDINVDLLKSDIASGRYAEALKTLCDENSLEQLIHQPTKNSASERCWRLGSSRVIVGPRLY